MSGVMASACGGAGGTAGLAETSGSAIQAPLACADQHPHEALDRFVQRPDSSFGWSLIAEEKGDDGTLFRLQLTSQQWRGAAWTHPLLLFVPTGGPDSDLALLVLRHGGSDDGDAASLRTISRSTGTAAAMLFDLPNQPLFGGLEEDPLLAFTFSQYLRTGDSTWPLLFPMVRSVVSAMDAMQDLGGLAGGTFLERFVVAGHSKRGQTAWLTGAADTRVKGIIPIANDVLNSPAQIVHHRAVAGDITGASQIFSEVIEAAESPRGRCLIAMIDPFTYRDRLAAPKLVVLGTNDAYTPTDALNVYWDALSGPGSVLYLPNTTHVGANSHPAVNPTAFAFVRAVAAGTTMPALEVAVEVRDGAIEARVGTEAAVRAARLWTSASADREFRTSQWSAAEMRKVPVGGSSGSEAYAGEASLPPTGFAALFVELEFEGDGAPFKLSSPIRIIESGRNDVQQ